MPTALVIRALIHFCSSLYTRLVTAARSIIGDQTGLSVNIDSWVVMKAIGIMSDFEHVLDAAPLNAPKLFALGADNNPTTMTASQLLPLLKIQGESYCAMALSALLHDKLLAPNRETVISGGAINDDDLAALISLQSCRERLSELCAADIARNYATFRLAQPFAITVEWAKSLTFYTSKLVETLLRSTIEHCRNVMKNVNSVEVISSYTICFDAGKQSFDEGTGLIMSSGQLERIIQSHSALRGARSDMERVKGSLAIDSSVDISDYDIVLEISRKTMRNCKVAAAFVQGCDILQNHRHATSGYMQLVTSLVLPTARPFVHRLDRAFVRSSVRLSVRTTDRSKRT